MSSFGGEHEAFPRLGEEAPLEHRGRVVRMALFHGAIALGSAGLVITALYKIVTGDAGFLFMLGLFGFFGSIFAYWALHYLRDLSARPVTVQGEVLKKWHKGNILIFFMPSFYILVEGKIFTIGRQEYAMLLELDLVRISCYPHSLTIEKLERFDETDKKFIPAASGATF
ncbi:MAG TPA: hypothetical protein VJB57_17075 [Dehalococcoidia bacterium]|nr:hypothetical protein [Dehalococcoidia bacterium]